MGEETVLETVLAGTVDNPFLFDATPAELEKFLLTNIFVAGKNASVQQKKLDQFIDIVKRELGEYAVNSLGVLSAIHHGILEADLATTVKAWLMEAKTGQYSRISAGLMHASNRIGSNKLNLKKCKRENLVGIPGIGYKTASMFLMYTRKGWCGACLDTHILKYMREELQLPDIPASTPMLKPEYERLEKLFVDSVTPILLTKKQTIAEFDFEIWSRYRVKVD
ncbi:MAG: hypothetical protein ABFC56_13365 [Clostridiaceae bacterium]